MPFSHELFIKHATRLQVIVMSRISKPPLTNFNLMNPKQKRVFDTELNAYIKQLPAGLEEDTLLNDFNTVCHEEVFNLMKPAEMVIERSTPEELQQTEHPDLIQYHTGKIEI